MRRATTHKALNGPSAAARGGDATTPLARILGT